MSKLSLFTTLCLLLALFTGCSNDDGNTPKLTITGGGQQTLYANSEVAWLTFTAEAEWEVFVPDKDRWVSVVEDQDYAKPGERVLFMDIEPNFSGETRTATVTILSRMTQQQVTLTQSGQDTQGKVPEPYYLLTEMVRIAPLYDAVAGSAAEPVFGSATDPASGSATLSTRTSPQVDPSANVKIFTFNYNTNQQLDWITVKHSSDEYTGEGFTYDYTHPNEIVIQGHQTTGGLLPTGTFKLNDRGWVESYQYNAPGTVVNCALQYDDDRLIGGSFTATGVETGTSTIASTVTWTGDNLTKLAFGAGDNKTDLVEIRYSSSDLRNRTEINFDLNYLIDQTGFFSNLPLSDNFYLQAAGRTGKRSKYYLTEQRDLLDGANYNFIYEMDARNLPIRVAVVKNSDASSIIQYDFSYKPVIRKAE
jgi:hypothetical protein